MSIYEKCKKSCKISMKNVKTITKISIKNAKTITKISMKNAKNIDNDYIKSYNIRGGVIMERKIYKELLEWKENNIEMPLMIIRRKTSWKNIYHKRILPK